MSEGPCCRRQLRRTRADAKSAITSVEGMQRCVRGSRRKRRVGGQPPSEHGLLAAVAAQSAAVAVGAAVAAQRRRPLAQQQPGGEGEGVATDRNSFPSQQPAGRVLRPAIRAEPSSARVDGLSAGGDAAQQPGSAPGVIGPDRPGEQAKAAGRGVRRPRLRLRRRRTRRTTTRRMRLRGGKARGPTRTRTTGLWTIASRGRLRVSTRSGMR